MLRQRRFRSLNLHALGMKRNEFGSRSIVVSEASRCRNTSERFITAKMVTVGFCAVTKTTVPLFCKANASSGGKVTSIELGDFLGKGKAGPEHQALARLVGGLAEDQGRGDGKEHAGDNGQG